jgi:hypothetical protein
MHLPLITFLSIILYSLIHIKVVILIGCSRFVAFALLSLLFTLIVAF